MSAGSRDAAKLQIEEIIVVEGIHDRQAVEGVADAEVWVIGGDRIAARFLQSLTRAAAARGVIVLTDPDGPGERIRARIAKAVPAVKHAFVPRREAVAKHGVGIEHAGPESIRQALLSARPTALRTVAQTFTSSDLLEAGLSGTPDAAARRQQVGECLKIGSGNAKAFLRKLNTLGVTPEEWNSALKQVDAFSENGRAQ